MMMPSVKNGHFLKRSGKSLPHPFFTYIEERATDRISDPIVRCLISAENKGPPLRKPTEYERDLNHDYLPYTPTGYYSPDFNYTKNEIFIHIDLLFRSR